MRHALKAAYGYCCWFLISTWHSQEGKILFESIRGNDMGTSKTGKGHRRINYWYLNSYSFCVQIVHLPPPS